MATFFRVAFLLGEKREDVRSCFSSFFGNRADGVCAEECRTCFAEPGDSGELRFGDHAGGVRRARESAAVQECAS